MSGTFNLKILTPERVVLDTVVSQVTATARDGQLSILAHHEPLVTALGIDALKYWEDGEEKSAAVIGGVLEVANHQTATAGTDQAHNPDDLIVTIISDSAEPKKLSNVPRPRRPRRWISSIRSWQRWPCHERLLV